jgi:hypothetical protein
MVSITVQFNFSYALSFRFFFFWQAFVENGARSQFSLISPVIESSHVFKAIETAIPIDVIEQTIGSTEVREERKRKLPSSLVVCQGNCHEPVVK